LHKDLSVKHQAQFKQWLSPVSSAAALALLMAAGNAAALGLGSIHVRSNLGEVFSADIDINTITASEAESLRVNLADSMAYEAAGLEMSTALQGVTVSLEKRADGRSYLQIRGSRPVNDPFMDVLIQTDNSESGRATRGYTVLIDPPAGLMKAPKIAAPALTAETKAPRAKPEPVRQPRASVESDSPTPPPATPPVAQQTGEGVRVQRGSTAGAIARQMAAHQGVSYDQMLAALVRQNPDAFIGGNVNRIKTGAVLQTPTTEQATSISQQEAKRQWMTSGNNFKQYRRRLAQMDGQTLDNAAGRSSRGSVAGEATDQSATAAPRDKLTLGKARAHGNRRSAEDKVLRKRHRAESSARQAELSKNIEDLKKLSGAAGQSTTPSAANPASKKNAAGVAVSAPLLSAQTEAQKSTVKATPQAAPKVELTHTPSPVASKATPIAADLHANAPAAAAVVASAAAAAPVASAPEATASAPADNASAALATEAAGAEQAQATAVPTAAPILATKPKVDTAPETTLVDKLKNWALPLGGGLLGAGVLGGLGFALLRRRKRNADGAVDSAAFLESKLEADSFFDASGGQRVDTSSHSSGISSSMVYSPSQLDAAGDVDPVAEAGVYMAYNRDQQAEDILKEAMRTNPSRVAIYTTLMEIYAKRGDVKAFDVVAREAHHLTGGQGEDWAKAVELGRQLDPANPMYGDGGAAPSTGRDDAQASGHDEDDAAYYARPAAAPTAPMSLDQAQSTAKIEAEDLDMVFRNSDFKMPEPEEAVSAPAHLATTPMQVESLTAAAPLHAPTEHMDLSFDLDVPTPGQAAAPVDAAGADMQFTEAALSGHAPLAIDEPLKFDMSDLSLDLSDAPVKAQPAALPTDPWETKLELMREFVALGDNDGARSIADEVIASAPADVADKARTFIATMV
jgi:pilus assembly protein FimV